MLPGLLVSAPRRAKSRESSAPSYKQRAKIAENTEHPQRSCTAGRNADRRGPSENQLAGFPQWETHSPLRTRGPVPDPASDTRRGCPPRPLSTDVQSRAVPGHLTWKRPEEPSAGEWMTNSGASILGNAAEGSRREPTDKHRVWMGLTRASAERKTPGPKTTCSVTLWKMQFQNHSRAPRGPGWAGRAQCRRTRRNLQGRRTRSPRRPGGGGAAGVCMCTH